MLTVYLCEEVQVVPLKYSKLSYQMPTPAHITPAHLTT